jgi:hypothetical protein
MRLSASALGDWARCPEQFRLKRDGRPREQTSATAYGTVVHHALHVMERYRDVDKALQTFAHYWDPRAISEITEPIPANGWLPRHTYSSLREQGLNSIQQYADMLKWDDAQVLALEFPFEVPLHGTLDQATGEPHTISGFVDRLTARHVKRVLCVGLDDWKTGVEPAYLRHNLQGTVYAYASTQPEFWTGWREKGTEGFGDERGHRLFEQFREAPRRFTWINLQRYKFVDGGFRTDLDYNRLRLAVDAVARSIQNDIYPLSISGATCQWCPFRSGVCAGVGLPDDDSGAP